MSGGADFGFAPLFCGGLADTASRDNVKHRAGTKRNGAVEPVRLLQLSAAGEVFLEGTCPLSRCPQTAKFPVPILLGARRRWVRKATAFRGRSEQDRSALFPACCSLILKTFRRNVFNGLPVAETCGHGTPCPYKMCSTRTDIQKISRKTSPPPNGGPPRTERSPLPFGHLPTPWGVTPFRGG